MELGSPSQDSHPWGSRGAGHSFSRIFCGNLMETLLPSMRLFCSLGISGEKAGPVFEQRSPWASQGQHCDGRCRLPGAETASVFSLCTAPGAAGNSPRAPGLRPYCVRPHRCLASTLLSDHAVSWPLRQISVGNNGISSAWLYVPCLSTASMAWLGDRGTPLLHPHGRACSRRSQANLFHLFPHPGSLQQLRSAPQLLLHPIPETGH